MDLGTERQKKPFRDGSRDQRIIDLTLAGDRAALRGFSRKVGTDIAAVRARAKRLGLTPGFLKNCRLAGTRPKMRACLRCDDRFLSRGAHNRMCRRCARRA